MLTLKITNRDLWIILHSGFRFLCLNSSFPIFKIPSTQSIENGVCLQTVLLLSFKMPTLFPFYLYVYKFCLDSWSESKWILKFFCGKKRIIIWKIRLFGNTFPVTQHLLGILNRIYWQNFIFLNLFGCMGSQLQQAGSSLPRGGSSSPTSDWTDALYIGNAES